MGIKQEVLLVGMSLGTHWELGEHLGNSMRTFGELDGNIFGT
jgi:hypothetical protein